MFDFDIYSEKVLRTEAAAYPCGVCPPEYPCYDPPEDIAIGSF
jgi:hypothetical protein